jgi:hypothetical protein
LLTERLWGLIVRLQALLLILEHCVAVKHLWRWAAKQTDMIIFRQLQLLVHPLPLCDEENQLMR